MNFKSGKDGFMRFTKTFGLILVFALAWISAAAQKPDLVVQSGHSREISYAVFRPDGKVIASVAADVFAGAEVKVWNAETGKLVYTFACAFYRGDPLVFFSRSGNLLATYDGWGGYFDVWDLRSGKKIAEEISPEASDANWANLLKKGEFDLSLTKIKAGEYDRIYHRSEGAAVSADSRKRLEIEGNKITVFDNQTDKKLSELGRSSKIIGQVAISSSGEKFAFTIGAAETTNGFEGLMPIEVNDRAKVAVWAAADAPKFYEGEFDFLSTPAFSPDGKLLAATAAKKIESVDDQNEKVVEEKHSVVVWNTESGKIARRIEGETFFDFNRDGSAYLTKVEGETEQTVRREEAKIYNAESGELIKTFEGRDVEMTPDKKNVVVWKDRLNFDFFSLATGQLEGAYKIPAAQEQENWGYKFFQPNGEHIFLVEEFDASRIKLFDFKAEKSVKDVPHKVEKNTFEHPTETVLSPDGSAVATLNFGGNRGYSGSLYNLQTGTTTEILGTASLPAFNRAGNLLGVGTLHGDLAIYDAASGETIGETASESGGIGAVAFHPNDFVFTSVNGDNSIKIYSPKGKLLATLAASGDDDWLVITPEGFFDGTAGGWEKIGWRFQSNPFEINSVEPYFNDFFYPNLLQDILAGNSPKPRAGQALEQIDRRQPTVKIAAINNQSASQSVVKLAAESRTAKISIEVTDNAGAKKQPNHNQTSGAQDLRLFRNGALVRVWHGDIFETAKSGCEKIQTKPNEPRRVRCIAETTITSGANRFTAYAFNSANVKSSDATAQIESGAKPREGTLYVLAIGVNRYANQNFNLRFAVPDVLEIGTAIENEQEKLRRAAKMKQYAATKIIRLTDETATRENITLALERFTKEGAQKVLPDDLCANITEEMCGALKLELGKIKLIEPEDALVIYYAGHGTSIGERFYLLPHNYTGGEKAVIEQGVSDEKLNEILERVDAGKLLMTIDACQSGQALGAKDAGRAPMNSKGLAQLAYDKGMLILTATQSREAALEAVRIGNREIKHGLLTFALIEALTAADKDANQPLREREWLDYAVGQVPRLQRAAMKERSAEIHQTGRGTDIFYLDGDDKNAKPEDRAVQTPRVFYRRETDANPMIVAMR